MIAAAALLLAAAPGCRLASNCRPLSRATDRSRDLTHQGRVALELGQLDAAEEYLTQAADACPEDADACNALAETLWLRGRRDEALATIDKACQLAPDHVEAALAAARMELGVGRPGDALARVEQALDVAPESPEGWRVAGEAHAAAGDYDRAAACLEKSHRIDPTRDETLQRLVDVQIHQDRPAAAYALLRARRRSGRTGGDATWIDVEQGRALLAMHRYEDAAATLRLASQGVETSADLWRLLAAAEQGAGRPEAAMLAMRNAHAAESSRDAAGGVLSRAPLHR